MDGWFASEAVFAPAGTALLTCGAHRKSLALEPIQDALSLSVALFSEPGHV